MMGGRSGVELCPSRSMGSSGTSKALMSSGSGGPFGRMIDAFLDRAGVAGGVTGSCGPRCDASDLLDDGVCSEAERDGGALLTRGFDREMVAFLSVQRLVMEGQRRLCPRGLPLVAASPDLRRLKSDESASPSKVSWSSPCVHSGLRGDCGPYEGVIVFRWSQLVVSPD